jgi:transcriptional regulator with XRE-family HTH domain
MSVIERGQFPRKRRIIDFDIAIGRRIRLQRTIRDVTQAELGNAIGITFQQIQKYELGANRISAGKLLQVAHFLRAPIGVFFEGLDDSENAEPHRISREHEQLQAFVVSGEGERLYRAFSRIRSKGTLLSLIRMVESLADAGEAS